ncbi:glycoside hydrolase family 2 protein [Zobellia uliginosa]|uniref:glycoside hydrolase family 2 protein n=1 Tax=Zobellia uliginosa TaxID=143224 RepID=UPI0026E2620E|nr:sugar-binding domain-containing protein [Zobellia uliginosa]MDO6518767.1 glycoside hydrolase family 2 TIM barrel-domain containing protein [Zobellia uliginosa]
MRNFASLTLFAIVFLSSCSPKKGDTVLKNETLSLNGEWHFLASNEESEEQLLTADYTEWDTLTVPGNWDVENKYAHFKGKGYYQRNFTLPENWQKKQVRLKFDAVYETSKVWLNGELLGEHEGGYTPFEFNITDHLRTDKPNSILVMADNTFRRGAWWAWGGISRDVSLLAHNDVRLVRQHISAVPDFDNGVVDFAISYKIENNSDTPQNLNINPEILGPDHKSWQPETLEVTVTANETTEKVLTFKKELKEVELWHFDRPHLYVLNSSLVSNDQEVDAVSDKFGIRKMEAIGEQLFLNNEAVRLNGFNRVHDHRLYGNTEPDELIKNDILDIKALGGNFSRIMHAPASKNLLQFCDSIGYMIIEEIPVWGRGAPNAIPDNPRTKKWLDEMIARDFNHASVVGWSMGNEIGNPDGEWADMTMTPGQYEYVNDMLDHVASLDSTRLKTVVSFTSHLPLAKPGNEPYEKLDLLCMNSYGETYEKLGRVHAKFPGKPIFISEIGDKQIGLTPDAGFSDTLIEQLDKIRTLPYVVGSALWTYNDYRSDYKATPPSENRAWGVVDVWRNKKKAYKQIQDIYAPVQGLKASVGKQSLSITLLPRNEQDIPAYIMEGYTLVYEFFNAQDQSIGKERIELPTIKPGDDPLEFNFKNKNNVARIDVGLWSPMQIEVKTTSSKVWEKPAVEHSDSPVIEFLGRKDERISIGYTVSEKDSIFTFKYGNAPEHLTKEITTDLKGAIKIEWPSSEPFFVKLKSDVTDWSTTEQLIE